MQIRDKNPENFTGKNVYTNFRANTNVDISKQIQTSKEEVAVKNMLNELKELQDMVGDDIDVKLAIDKAAKMIIHYYVVK